MVTPEKHDPFAVWANGDENSSILSRLDTISLLKDPVELAVINGGSDKPKILFMSLEGIPAELKAAIRQVSIQVLSVNSEPVDIDYLAGQIFTYRPEAAMIKVEIVFHFGSNIEVKTLPMFQDDQFTLGLFKHFRDQDTQGIPLFKVTSISEDEVALGTVEEAVNS